MNNLAMEGAEVLKLLAAAGIPGDVYSEHPINQPGKPVRLYVTSRRLGGLLIANHGDGWLPIYPERPNYPMRGRWYSPSSRVFPAADWRDALKACLNPVRFLRVDEVGQRTAEQRAAKLRPQLLAAVVIALLEEG